MKRLTVLLVPILFLLSSIGCLAPSSTSPMPTIVFSPNPTSTSAPSPTPTGSSPQGQLFVHFIDVGQGDSILVDLGDTEVLIDGGDRQPGIVPYLTEYINGPLEVMVATHPHADHIGGFIDVLAAFDVEQIWTNGETSDSKTYSDFMAGVNAEGAQVHITRLHDTISAGDLLFYVHNPADLSGSTNNNSVVLHLAYGEIEFLFTGDAEQEAEGHMVMLSSLRLPEVEVLKVGHHGSRTASSAGFLSITSPEVAIYMAGVGNSYGHPHAETTAALTAIGASIYGTDVNGDIVISTDGETYDVRTEKSPTGPIAASPSASPSPTPSTSPASGTSADVKITNIFYDGVVPNVESDEYVEITNLGTEAVNLNGWVLKDVSDGYPSFTFSSYVLQPGRSVRVYTNEIHPEYGGFSFGYGKAVWNNSSPDTAALYDAQGREISRKSY